MSQPPLDQDRRRDEGEAREEKREPREYPAERARQGDVVLDTPLRRALFFGGLLAFVLIALIGALLGFSG